jgi:hypothetical protein
VKLERTTGLPEFEEHAMMRGDSNPAPLGIARTPAKENGALEAYAGKLKLPSKTATGPSGPIAFTPHVPFAAEDAVAMLTWASTQYVVPACRVGPYVPVTFVNT